MNIDRFGIWILVIISSLVIGHWSLAYASPIISNEELVSVADDHVVITWRTTNEVSNTGIKFGFSADLGNVTKESTTTNYHYLTLGNLYPNTTYYYRIFCESATGTSEGVLRSFRTLERPSGNYLFSFAVFSDLHYAPNKANTQDERGRPYASSEALTNTLVTEINKFNPAFTIIKGDMIDADIDLAAYSVATSLKPKLDNLNAGGGAEKYYPIPGNHDKYPRLAFPLYDWVTDDLGVLYPAGASIPTGDSTFNYSFSYNGYRFIMLDSVSSLGTTAEVNITSLEAELQIAKDNKEKAFIFMHHAASEETDIPTEILKAILDVPVWDDALWDWIRIKNSAAFFNALKNYKLDNGEYVVASVFCGHIHDNRKREIFGIPVVRTSSAMQFPTGYNIYKVYSGGYMQSFYKIPGYSEAIARDLITGTAEATANFNQQFYLGGSAARNFTVNYSSMTTTVSPTLESIQPANGATGVALDQPIILAFTKSMTKETTVSSWINIKANNTPVSFSSSNWSWNSDKTALTLSITLEASKTYLVTVEGTATGATATDGTFFASDYTFAFTTGTSTSGASPSVAIEPIKNQNGIVTDVTGDPTPTFTGIATDESGSTIANVEFSYASGSWSGWYPATPLDGAFNSSIEVFSFTITGEVARGEHEVRIRTTNAAGVSTTTGFTTYTFYVVGNQPEITLKADGKTIVNGDPISSTPSLEITVVTDQTLDQLRLIVDGSSNDIMPASPSYVNVITTSPLPLTTGSHNIRIEAVDKDSLGTTRISTKEAVNLSVQTAGDVTVIGIPLNYPNPFNAGTENTRIAYTLSRSSNVTLTIHDLAGNMIAKRDFVSGQSGGSAGYNEVTWDGRSDGGDVIGNGIYLYLIIADGRLAARGKITVLKQ